MATITAIATAVPELDFEKDYRRWALSRLGESREAKLFERIAHRSGIEHRWSVLGEEDARLDEGVGFYGGAAPSTAARMEIYAREAPELALRAIRRTWSWQVAPGSWHRGSTRSLPAAWGLRKPSSGC